MAIATTKEPFFFYSVLGGIYILIAFFSSRLQMALETRVNANMGGRA